MESDSNFTQISHVLQAIRVTPEVAKGTIRITLFQGWDFAGVFFDEAKTGTKDNRSGFQEMLSACRSGQIDMIITKSISRFARNTVTLLEIVRELKTLDIDVFFEEQKIHTKSSDGELMLSILASYAQEESLSASENQKWRVKKNFEAGIPCYGKLLGYRLENGRYEIVPEEAEIVREIFNLYLSGMGLMKIANQLNEEGKKTGTNHSWQVNGLYGILRNDTYTGSLTLQKTFKEDHISKRKRKNEREYPKYIVEDSHEAIISREVFDAAQQEIAYHQNSFVKIAAASTVKRSGTLQTNTDVKSGGVTQNLRIKQNAVRRHLLQTKSTSFSYVRIIR